MRLRVLRVTQARVKACARIGGSYAPDHPVSAAAPIRAPGSHAPAPGTLAGTSGVPRTPRAGRTRGAGPWIAPHGWGSAPLRPCRPLRPPSLAFSGRIDLISSK